jgi:sigma-B regulation protein RsbU (phosphoserine phosphatase)
MVHRILQRQLKKLGISDDAPPPTLNQWRDLLERVNQVYHDADEDRYTLERSLTKSSEELRRANEIKDHFFNQLSEDLRAPLLTILARLSQNPPAAIETLKDPADALKTKIDALLQVLGDTHPLDESLEQALESAENQKPEILAEERSKRWQKKLERLSNPSDRSKNPNAKSLVYVDSDPDFMHYMHDLLSPHYDLTLAETIEEGFIVTKTLKPAAVLCLEQLADGSGIELLRSIRKEPWSQSIPFFMLSSSLSELRKVEAIEAGATEYFRKPFIERELMAKLARVLQLYDQEQKNQSELTYARAVQAKIIAKKEESFESCHLSALFQPASSLSGDYYWWSREEDWVHLFLADVTGHGTGAALPTFLINEAIRATLRSQGSQPPNRLIEAITQHYASYEADHDIALQVARYHLRSGQLEYARANSPGGFITAANGESRALVPRAASAISKNHLDSLKAGTIKIVTTTLNPGDRLFLFSDGAYEFQSLGIAFTREQLCQELVDSETGPDWADSLYKKLLTLHSELPFPDDLSILKLEISTDSRPSGG